jgi:DDE family transposase
MQNDWAYNEIWRAKLWDPRCYHTLSSALQKLAEHAQISFSRALGSQRKAISHILHHPKVLPEDLLLGHVRATKLRCQDEELILVASDTTSMDFTTHTAVEGLGPLENRHRRGFLVHSALAMTSAGCPLGLLYQHSWARDPEQIGLAQKRRERAFEDKESYKWLLALRGVEKALPVGKAALLIQDQEADIFEFFAAKRRPEIHLLIRAAHPRRLEIENQGDPRYLSEALEHAPVVATLRVRVYARPDREAREALLSIRMAQVKILPPLHGKDKNAQPIPLQGIGAWEEDAPSEVKEPIHWTLLTSLAVPDVAAALRILGYYTKRWRIERFHYVLKSGCNVEKLQLDQFETLSKAMSLYSIVAWRLLHLTYLAREVPQAPVEEALSGTERFVLELASGKPIRTVQEALLAVAKIAGFRPVPSAPNPGVKSLWLGFRKLNDLLTGFELARQPPPLPKGQD